MQLLEHQYFDSNFKQRFERDLGSFMESPPKKNKSKITLTQKNTPEPSSYMKIYNKKKSPKFASPIRATEENIKLKKTPQPSNKHSEKSYFFPDIIRKEGSINRKKSTRYIKKIMEIRTDAKSTLKSSELSAIHNGSRNPSLVHDASNESFVKSSFGNPVLSNRHQNLSRKEIINSLTPDPMPNISFLPGKYRLKRHENLKITNSRSNIGGSNNFSPINK